MTPAIIDSQGKPGTAGIISGVETELVLNVVVIGVLVTVTVDSVVAVDVTELVVTDSVFALDDVEVELSVEVVAPAVELELVEFVFVACCPTTGGFVGSR